MTWVIGDITLPIEPSDFSKKTQRVQQPTQTVGDFPDPTINQPTKFEMQIKGYIWPRQLAQQLDEYCKNADTENIVIYTDDDSSSSQPWVSGYYAVTRSDISRKKPLFTRDPVTGQDVEVYEYDIAFAKFADAGSDQPSEEGGPEGSEVSAGFLDMDSDNDGDIDLEGIYNFLTSIFTWGASDPV